jgi:hypothetical protein
MNPSPAPETGRAKTTKTTTPQIHLTGFDLTLIGQERKRLYGVEKYFFKKSHAEIDIHEKIIIFRQEFNEV